MTSEHPDARLTSLGLLAKERGYRTGFFYGSDTRYQGADAFLNRHGFDVVLDYRAIPCRHPTFVDPSSEEAYLEGTDDVCTARAFIDWLSARPEDPFFATVWTAATHYPYFVTGDEVAYDTPPETPSWWAPYFNRYLNALRRSDEALGLILSHLEQSGLSASTLVVVVGDHGEAFGRHDQFGHGTSLYEENVHVPLVLINPRLFSGERDETIGGPRRRRADDPGPAAVAASRRLAGA